MIPEPFTIDTNGAVMLSLITMHLGPVEVTGTEDWIVVNAVPGDRSNLHVYGIWRKTGRIYKADEDGAMGDEPLDSVVDMTR